MNPYFKNLRSRLEDRLKQVLPDVGMSCLGIAALFLVRAFPPSASLDFNLWPLGISAGFFILGLFFRAFFKSEV